MLRFAVVGGMFVSIEPSSVMSVEEYQEGDDKIAYVVLSNGKCYKVPDPNRTVARNIQDAKEKR